MTEVTYSTWIAAALRPLDAAEDRFYVEAVTDFYHQFVVPRYSDKIAAALREVTGRDIRLTIDAPADGEYRNGANLEIRHR